MPGSTTPLTSWARELPSHPGPRATLAPRDEAFSTADARRAILAATGSPGAEDYVTRCTYDAFNWRLTETTPTSQALPWRHTTDAAYDGSVPSRRHWLRPPC